MQKRVQVYSTPYCGYCVRAKALLDRLRIPFEEIDVAGNYAARAWLAQTTGQRTVPQIFIDGESIGGYRELDVLARAGRLRELFPEVAPVA
jgi:glutaredoxin 3